MPRHESIVRPGSRCPRCRAPVGALDNVPILSWVLLRGRCRHCKERIAWRYPAVEVATAALFLLCYLRFGLTFQGITTAILCFLLLGLAVMDAETMRLPDAFTLPGIALGILYSGFYEAYFSGYLRHPVFSKMLLAAIVAAGAALLLLLIRWLYFAIRHKEGLGMGDVKLIAMIAAWLGAAPAILTLLLGALAAAFYGIAVVALARGSRPMRSARLPFGSFLCAAALYTIFAGDPMIRWYLHFYGLSY